jgi:hypothetical protein
LFTELIARKAEDRKAFGFVVFVKGTQTCVLRREASLARDVDYQTDFVFVARKIDRLAGDRIHFQIVKPGHCSLLGTSDRNLRLAIALPQFKVRR